MTILGRPSLGARAASRMRRARRQGRVILRVYAMGVRSRLEYRVDLAVSVLVGLAWQLSTLAFLGVLLTHFSRLGELTAGGVILMYGIRLFAHALYVVVFLNLTTLPYVIESSRMDGYLLRPMPVLLQVLLTDFQLNGIGDLAIGTATLAAAISLAGIDWTVGSILFLVVTIIGGALLEAAVQLLISCLLLRSPATIQLSDWVDELMSTFGSYPLSVFPLVVQLVFTIVIPVAFIAYFPVRVLLGLAAADGPAKSALEYSSPALGIMLFVVALSTWNWALRHYHSVGG
jgi:viologen exporter family transport system permease protein